MTPGDEVLVAAGLTKRFGQRTAVDSLDLEVRAGEVFGLLGPNGSGKSTTVGLLLGLIRPTSGTIRIFGKDLSTNRWDILQHIGAIIESPSFYPYLSGRDNLLTFARPLSVGHRVPGALARMDLEERADDAYHSYSLGMKQRLGIASTLLRDPKIVILDEPTNGLDPAGTRAVRELIPRLASEGRAVILCSHLLHEVELVCDRVAILKKGKCVWRGSIEEIMDRAGAVRIRVDEPAQRRRALDELLGMEGIDVIAEGAFITVSGPALNASELNHALNLEGILISELLPLHASLENVFLELTEAEG